MLKIQKKQLLRGFDEITKLLGPLDEQERNFEAQIRA